MGLVQLLVLVLALLQLSVAQQLTDAQGRRRCGQGEVTCGDGRCIDYRRLCDGRRDCADGSDETGCGPNRCQPNELQCNNGKCVMKHWRCDGDDDCGDGTDEQNCQRQFPGSRCSGSEFQCADQLQCVPRTFQCDDSIDCLDGSDETGCAAPVIVEQPPAVKVITIGGAFVIRCRAVGTPTPEISWRRNWHHVPEKCRQESLEGRGTLTCPDAAATDQGAYSCEAINTRGVVFAIPDTNVVVTNGGICQPPEFNSAALTNDDCQRCFCFGATTDCSSSSLFISELPAPRPEGFSLISLDRLRGDSFVIQRLRERPYPGRTGEIQVRLPQLFDTEAYFSLPDSHTGSQLNSYGGYLRFSLQPTPTNDGAPEVVIQGNGVTIWYMADVKPAGGDYTIRILEGSFFVPTRDRRPRLATREQIMMALENIDYFLIRAPPGPRRDSLAVLSGVRLDTATRSQTPQGPAALVEQCRCPRGYTGQSCQECAAGYERRPGGRWLGTCEPRFQRVETCRDGEYGDPGRDIPCRPCPCPGPQQYGRTCSLAADDQVTCDCQPGYAGRRCEQCAAGYRGEPSQGQPCVPGGECDPAGSLEENPDPRTGQCKCKEFVTGRRCDRCVPRAFHLSSSNQHGCINCFCSGVTDQCTSTQWYRQQETAMFASDTQDVTLTDDILDQSFDGVSVDRRSQSLVFKDFDRVGSKPAYWSLPSRFLGDKVTAYGGSLRLNMSFAAPAGAQSYPDYPDVEIFGNDVRLGHLVAGGLAANQPISMEVPLLEQAWRRDDGGPVDREHLLMALADLEYIIFKAADATGSTEATLSGVELDVATQRFTGQEPAHSVEQCSCPVGYKGLSCEDCDVGYTRSLSGLYLRTCIACDCGGRSDECDPETGECLNCRENTAGPRCDVCRDGYEGDPTRGQPCRRRAGLECDCDPRGSRSEACNARQQCDCKAQVEGDHCDRCRAGSFGLGTDPEEGCARCFCSGVSQQCSVARLYRSQLPMSVLDDQHGVSLTNSEGIRAVDSANIVFSAADNEVSYRTTPEKDQALYWALPDLFTGDQLSSYGGSLTVRQRLNLRSRGGAQPDTLPDIILYGGGVELRLRTPSRPQPDGRLHTYTVQLGPEEGWVDGETGARADRSLLMSALSDVEAVLIRATLAYSDGQINTYLSNVVLDTAIATSTRQGLVDTIEQCRCPAEYQGLSCQECAPGHYRSGDQCRRCPCSGNEQSCELDDTGEVVCDCRPGFGGRRCETEGVSSGDQRPDRGPSRDDQSFRGPSRDDQSPRGPSRDDQSFRGPSRDGQSFRGPSRDDQSFRGPSKDDQSPRGPSRDDQSFRGPSRDDQSFRGPSRDDQSSRGPSRDDQSSRGPSRDDQSSRGPSRDDQSFRGPSRDDQSFRGPSRDDQSSRGPSRDDQSSRGPSRDDQSFRGPSRDDQSFRGPSRDDQSFRGPSRDGQSPRGPSRDDQSPRGPSRDDQSPRGPSRDDQPTFEPPRVTITPRYLQLEAGQPAELRCEATGSPAPIISWSGGRNGLMEPDVSIINGLLVISAVQKVHEAEYTCTATNAAGTNSLRTMIYVRGGVAAPPRPAAGSPETEWPSQLVPGYQPSEPQRPQVVVYPAQQQKVPVGGSVLIQCRGADGFSQPDEVNWARADGKDMPPTAEILPGGVIRFIRVTGDEEGDYVCTASNTAGDVTITATIDVLSPPVIRLDQPTTYRVTEGDRVELTCSASGDPAPSVSWSARHNWSGQRGVPGRVTGTYSAVTLQDAGVHTCTATSEAGTAVERLQLLVTPAAPAAAPAPRPPLYSPAAGRPEVFAPARPPAVGAPGSIRTDRDVYVVPVNGRAELRCLVEGANSWVTLTWMRSGGLTMPTDHSIRSGTLYINAVQKDAEGVYTCLGIGASSVVLFKAEATLRVLEPPRIQLQPVRQVVQPGEKASIRCSASGDEPIQLAWSRVQGRLSDTTSVVNGDLLFSNIVESDAGRYICLAENEAGHSEGVAEVVVRRGASIVAFERAVLAYRGSSVTLRCDSSGFDGRISWSRRGGAPLPDTAVADDSSLTLRNVDESTSGVYLCSVQDQFGRPLQDSVTLTVEPAPPQPLTRECPPTTFPCESGECLPFKYFCDGNSDCIDGSDETRCDIQSDQPAEPDTAASPRGPEMA